MMDLMKKTIQFRRYVEGPEIVMIPGVAHALCVKFAGASGFKTIFLSGYAARAVLLGSPEVALSVLINAWKTTHHQFSCADA